MEEVFINILRFLIFLSLVLTTVELYQKHRQKKKNVSEDCSSNKNN
ncbi:hypothetical protein [Robertmurraya mangrovi]|nr:hypothetical protein [Bacillus sp. 31A1R]